MEFGQDQVVGNRQAPRHCCRWRGNDGDAEQQVEGDACSQPPDPSVDGLPRRFFNTNLLLTEILRIRLEGDVQRGGFKPLQRPVQRRSGVGEKKGMPKMRKQ